MSRFAEKGYFVRENAPAYFTQNMERTVRWFENILGWYSNIVERDAEGAGMYGAVFETPPEIEITHLAPFTGFHLFYGLPEGGMISFMQVQGVDRLYEYVTANGWTDITEPVQQPWGGKTCEIITIDGYIIRIFE